MSALRLIVLIVLSVACLTPQSVRAGNTKRRLNALEKTADTLNESLDELVDSDKVTQAVLNEMNSSIQDLKQEFQVWSTTIDSLSDELNSALETMAAINRSQGTRQPVETEGSGDEISQWVSRVTAYSSQYNENSWGARQVMGSPNVYPQYGDITGAWASQRIDAYQYLELEFPEALFVTGIDIYETYHAGGVKAIFGKDSASTWIQMWRTEEIQDIHESRIFSPPLQGPSTKQRSYQAGSVIKPHCYLTGVKANIDSHLDNYLTNFLGNEFTTAVANVSNAYDIHHGYFVAPYAGTYLFAVTMCTSNENWVNFDIMKNSQTIARGISGDENWHTCGSSTVVTQMNRGSKVWVEIERVGGNGEVSSHYGIPSFTGVFLNN